MIKMPHPESERAVKRNITTLSKAFVIVSALGALATATLVAAPAAAQWAPPPPEFIATTEPVYYENHAAYWYGGRWVWRDERGTWNHYEREPPALAQRRVQAPPARRSWGPSPPNGRRR